MSFFLSSFQVHEKMIPLPMLPVIFYVQVGVQANNV
jgi:hypothetical protein